VTRRTFAPSAGSRLGSMVAGAGLVALALNMTLLTVPREAALAASHSKINGMTRGLLCPVGQVGCVTWENASSGIEPWEFSTSKELTPAGGSMSASATAKLTQTILADGTLGSATMTAVLDTELVGGGSAQAFVQFNGDFETLASSIEVIGSASSETHGSVLVGGGATVQVQIDCESNGAIDATMQSSAGASGGAADVPMDATKAGSVGGTVAVASSGGRPGFCSVEVSMAADADTNRGASGTEAGSGKATLSLTILAADNSPSPTPDVDSDGDGMLDSWETDGIPYDDADGVSHRYVIDCDGDGQSDADPKHKDVFVEIDSMEGAGLAPTAADLQPVVDAFAGAPVANPDPSIGITLHTCLDETDLPVTPFLHGWPEFDAVAKVHFGTKAERVDTNALDLLAAKREVFHHAIFGNLCCGDTTSGKGELPGNELFVTLGGWSTPGGTTQQKAAAFMHELGHNLGLGHGGRDPATGPDKINYKPNYYSLMNYTWQFAQPWMAPGTWPLDPGRPGYSAAALADLDESALDECTDFTIGTLRGFIIPFTHTKSNGFAEVLEGLVVPETGFDWNGDKVNPASCDVREAVDLDQFYDDLRVSPGELLRGREDWSQIVFDFRGAPSFAEGAHESHEEPDITVEIDEHLEGILPRYDAATVAQVEAEREALARSLPVGGRAPSVAVVGAVVVGAVVVVLGGLLVARRRRSPGS
jgi:hypothetical protein